MAKKSVRPAGHEQPSHLILFREPGERNVSVLSSALRVGRAKGVRSRDSCAILSEKNGVVPKVYERLGLAAASLSQSDIKKLKTNGDIEDVVKNEIRTIPPDLMVSDDDSEEGPGIDMDPMTAYLQGIRDAAELAINFRKGEVGPSPVDDGGMMSEISSTKLSWHLRLIGLDRFPSLTGSGVSLAVLDTGIDLDHRDFRGRVVSGETAVSFVSGESVQDGNGHGTHCAGLAAGINDPRRGRRYGVASDASLLVGKVLSDGGRGYDSDILDGMDWAAEKGAKIISMSLGSPRSAGGAYAVAYERLASVLRAQGVLVVAAAGNASRRPQLVSPVENPGACPSIMAVAAIDRRKRIASFSCGQIDQIGEVNLSAPGVSVRSSWNDGGYRKLSGTSMATPLVAGVAALLLQKHPGYRPQDIWNSLTDSAVAIGQSQDFGAGLAQAPR